MTAGSVRHSVIRNVRMSPLNKDRTSTIIFLQIYGYFYIIAATRQKHKPRRKFNQWFAISAQKSVPQVCGTLKLNPAFFRSQNRYGRMGKWPGCAGGCARRFRRPDSGVQGKSTRRKPEPAIGIPWRMAAWDRPAARPHGKRESRRRASSERQTAAAVSFSAFRTVYEFPARFSLFS